MTGRHISLDAMYELSEHFMWQINDDPEWVPEAKARSCRVTYIRVRYMWSMDGRSDMIDESPHTADDSATGGDRSEHISPARYGTPQFGFCYMVARCKTSRERRHNEILWFKHSR